ncbi:class I SAM-dependent methyltransferase [Kitasatospora sp. NBC_00458]|uniref:class I SAM-dependent methyltransferase n=1 Tax=Kitasatospora sp. NBC_00458 TaxID=2903568 RepID=UPI002E1784C3
MLGETARTWLRRWDRQQERYSPDRDERFEVVVDTVGWLLEGRDAPRPRLVDLGCGTGSLTTRLARAFPRAEVVGVDADPLLLGLAEEAVAGTGTRLLARDLTAPGWADEIGPPASWDAVVSSTALHWLTPDELGALYRTLAGRLRPGGILVDADNRPPTDVPALLELTRHLRARRAHRTGRRGREDWDGWWKSVLSAPELAPLAEARARSPIASRTFTEPHDLTTAEQVRLLREAGFTHACTVWQCGDDGVLVAVR